MEGLHIAQKAALGDRVLSTFHDHVAHTILQLRQQRACHSFLLVRVESNSAVPTLAVSILRGRPIC